MSESIQHELDLIKQAISLLEVALPQIVTREQHNTGIEQILKASEIIKEVSLDKDLKSLAVTLKILSGGGSTMLQTVFFQSYILDILEMLTKVISDFETHGPPITTDASMHQAAGEFLIRLAGRITNRYKMNVLFEPDYEAKGIRAFMVLKELHEVVRFLTVNPDISINQNANLDNGLEIDLLSQDPPEELHRIAGSVLEVKNVQIFTETKPQYVSFLDPPFSPGSFDSKMTEFLNK
ncbi:MAG: hypothetical protein ACXAD7_07185 [Candidatus Kariarchaeaceae archaeon]|jgi:hypothetical protein